MSRKKKLIDRLLSMPRDFTFLEAKALLEICGYVANNKGKTSGSRVAFERGQMDILLHKPHPQKELKMYQVKKLIEDLKNGGDL